MRRIIGAAAALALAGVGPAFAKDTSQGPGNAGPKAEKHQGHDNEPRGHSPARSVDHDARDHGGHVGTPAQRRPDRLTDPRDVATPKAKEDRRLPQRVRSGNRATVTDVDWTVDGDRRLALVGSCPPGLAKKNNGCMPPGAARKRDAVWGYDYRPGLFGIPIRSGAAYAYYDGYLIPSSGNAAYIPLLGGALAVGRVWPDRYPISPIEDWQSRYYGFDDPDYYRATDNVIYRVDPASAAIQSIVALLTGGDFSVGAPMPAGFDVYNLPSPYRSRYADSEEALYRYADGRVYEIDPETMLIDRIVDLVS